MTITSLEDVCNNQLQDLWGANKDALYVLLNLVGQHRTKGCPTP